MHLKYGWNVKRLAGRRRWALENPQTGERKSSWGLALPLCRTTLCHGQDSCFQAVIRQPWGSVKTLFSFHLNCCIHPANWNPATGSQALSLKCCQVIETPECGIMFASDPWLCLCPCYIKASISVSPQRYFPPFFIKIFLYSLVRFLLQLCLKIAVTGAWLLEKHQI